MRIQQVGLHHIGYQGRVFPSLLIKAPESVGLRFCITLSIACTLSATSIWAPWPPMSIEPLLGHCMNSQSGVPVLTQPGLIATVINFGFSFASL